MICVLVWCVPLCGCMTSLAPMHGGKTLKKGQIRIATGPGMNISPNLIAGTFSEAVKAAEKLANGDESFTEEDGRRWFRLGGLATLFNITPMYELAIQLGITDWLTLGGRYAGGALELGAVGQVFSDGKWGVTLGVQGSFLSIAPKVAPGFDKVVKWLDLSRIDISVPVLAGYQISGGSTFYAGLMYRAILLSANGAIEAASGILAKTDINAPVHMFGGVIGARLGYKFIFVYGELGIHHVWWNPTVLGESLNMTAMVLYPRIGVTFVGNLF